MGSIEEVLDNAPLRPTRRWNRAADYLSLVAILALCLLGCETTPAIHHAESPTDSPVSANIAGGKSDLGAPTSQRPEFDAAQCAYDPTDMYEPRARFTKGPWTGECLDTKIRRPVQALRTPDATNPTLELANVFHDDGFWRALVPTDAVANVYFQLEYFPAIVPAGHTQIRIGAHGHSNGTEDKLSRSTTS